MLNVQVCADRTFAAAVTVPPWARTGDGVTLNDVIAGAAAGRVVPASAEVAPSKATGRLRPAIISRNATDILTAPIVPPCHR
jgi:hypothetical protein